MKKILISVKDNFTKNLYKEVLEKDGYNVLVAEDAAKLLLWTKIENPSLILIDIGIFAQDDFKEQFVKEINEKRIPIIAFAKFNTQENKERAMDLGARDFITSSDVSPGLVVRKVKILLGEQRTYQAAIKTEKHDGTKLMQDVLGKEEIICPICGQEMVLHLIRDLSKGKSYYKLSVICPDCV